MNWELEYYLGGVGVLKGQKFPKSLDQQDVEMLVRTPENQLSEEAIEAKQKLQ